MNLFKKKSFRWWGVLAIGAGLLAVCRPAIGQTITPATGGENISADDFATGTFRTLTGPVIQETAPGQLSPGDIRLRTPTGFVFDTGGTDPTVTVTQPKGNAVTVTLTSRTATELVFSLTGSSVGPPPNNPHRIEFGNIRVGLAQGSPLAVGELRNVGGAAPGGQTNYGSLSMVAGADQAIRVESAPNAGASVLSALNVTAGTSVTGWSNVRDQFGNFKRNEAATWSLISATGGVQAGDLVPAGDNRSAVFTGTLTGTGRLQATFSTLSSTPSGVLTVVPAAPDAVVLTTQPASTAVAGVSFSTQPVLELRDAFGNVVTGNSFTPVTAEALSGSALLQGTVQRTASSGIITFTDLSYNIAEGIELRFSSSGLTSDTSNTVTVSPAAADSLIFTGQPSNTNSGQVMTPPVRVRLTDEFGNLAAAQQEVALVVESGPGDFSAASTDTVTSDATGLAEFDNLSFNTPGTYTLRATSPILNNSVPSGSFTIADAGKLAGFEIEQSGGGILGDQTAGVSFDILIRAVDGSGALLDGDPGEDNFTGSVDLTTTSEFSGSTVISGVGPFTGGTFTHTVTLTAADSATITATNSAGSESGTGNRFLILPNAADPDSSFTVIEPDTLIADGVSEAEVTVTLKDAFGNFLTSGGDVVTVTVISGNATISGVSDEGDGTYTATVTAPDSVETTVIEATVNGETITQGETDLVFTFGVLSEFRVEASGGGDIPAQTAGTPFNISITALDAFDNVVESFEGTGATVEITSGSTIASGGGTTATFTGGVLSSHALTLTLTLSGDHTVTARRTGFSEQGSSNTFTVNAGAADPATSTISSGRVFLENNGTDNTTITVQLRDAFSNNITSGSNSVTLSTTGGSLGSTSGTTTNGIFATTLTAGTVTETALISGTVNGNPIDSNVEITITLFNRWTGSAGGNPANRTDWSNTGNWTLGSLPTTGQVTQIPAGLSLYPVISTVDPVLDFLNIEAGASVTLTDRTLTVNDEISGGGSLFGNGGILNMAGDIHLGNFIAGSSTVNLNGSSLQAVSGDFTADTLNVQQNVVCTGYMEAFTQINIDTDQTLTMDPGSQLVSFGDINISGTLAGNNSIFNFGANINGTNLALNATDISFDGTAPQAIIGFGDIKNLIINNPTTVTAQNDVTVTDTLRINDGQLIIGSGFSFVANEKEGLTKNLTMAREITAPGGWRMISAALDSTWSDFLDGTLTQGYPGATLYDVSNPDSLQPNALFYDETFPGTDNQRWRAPDDAGDKVMAGRGVFVYFFGDVAGDVRYNEPLPDTLSISGEEFDGDGTAFTFPVTYTAEADTGFNLLGNPFAATIDWDDGNWEKTNMDNVLYIWDASTNDYLTWNGLTGSLGDGTIMPFQGFWVKANDNSPLLKVNKSSKTTGGTFHRENRDREPAAMALELRAEGLTKSTHLSFTPEGETGKDPMDAYRLLPFGTDTYLELFTLFGDGTQLAINNLARSFGTVLEIPLYAGGYLNGNFLVGEYTLTWPEFRDIPDAWTLTLVDRQNARETDLRMDDRYVFTLGASKSREFSPNSHELLVPGGSSGFRLAEKSTGKKQEARFILRIDPGADADGLPDRYELGTNFPNPFRDSTTLPFATPLEGRVRLHIYDILGRKVRTLVDTSYPAGFHTHQWQPSSLASGVYLVIMQAGGQQFTEKITYIK